MFHMTFDFGFGYFWQLAFGTRETTIVDNAMQTSLKYPKGARPGAGHRLARRAARVAVHGGRALAGAQCRAPLDDAPRNPPSSTTATSSGMRPGHANRLGQYATSIGRRYRGPPRARGTGSRTALPGSHSAQRQRKPRSTSRTRSPLAMLTYYRQMLAFRRGHAVWGTGDVQLVPFDASAVVALGGKERRKRLCGRGGTCPTRIRTPSRGGWRSGAPPPSWCWATAAWTSPPAPGAQLPATAAAVFQVR